MIVPPFMRTNVTGRSSVCRQPSRTVQEITHISLWDAAGSPMNPLDIAALSEPKTTGSDGATFGIGDIEIAYTVFAKP